MGVVLRTLLHAGFVHSESLCAVCEADDKSRLLGGESRSREERAAKRAQREV